MESKFHAGPSPRHPASYRDPFATVYQIEGRIFRGLTHAAEVEYRAVRDTGLLGRFIEDGRVVKTEEVDDQAVLAQLDGYECVLEHEALPMVSYPYEWPFALLKRAALFHLQLQIDALQNGITLADASAFNIQFIGVRPVFIDVPSFRRYREGELWSGHRQFCENFLYPLLLWSEFGISHNAWYRGAIDGIPTEEFASLVRWFHWISPRMLAHVLLPAKLQGLAFSKRVHDVAVSRVSKARMPKSGYLALLGQLRDWISTLRPKASRSTWQDYVTDRSYDSTELATKKRFVADFVSASKPATIWDLGCNDGEFLDLALANGAKFGVGLDNDRGALDKAVIRADTKNLNFLPLFQDAANPTPGQGWLGEERQSIHDRANPDAVLALAIVHHLALGRNIPLPEVVARIVETAPTGVIEYVAKNDPMVDRILSFKGDIFSGYRQDAFEQALSSHARIVKTESVSKDKRTLYWFDRR